MMGKRTALLLIVVAMLLVMVACVYQPSKEAAAVTIAEAPDVVGCEDLGNVFGRSEFAAGMLNTHGIPNAKTEALEHAANMGATHVVWRSVVGDWMTSAGTTVIGEAYRCGSEV